MIFKKKLKEIYKKLTYFAPFDRNWSVSKYWNLVGICMSSKYREITTKNYMKTSEFDSLWNDFKDSHISSLDEEGTKWFNYGEKLYKEYFKTAFVENGFCFCDEGDELYYKALEISWNAKKKETKNDDDDKD